MEDSSREPSHYYRVDPSRSIYKQVWAIYRQDLYWTPVAFVAGCCVLTAGVILEALGPCPGKLCNVWQTWASGFIFVVGGFFAAISGSLLMAYLARVSYVKKNIAKGVPVKFRLPRGIEHLENIPSH
jgi:hypothetical protein